MGKSSKIFCEVCSNVFLPTNKKVCVCSAECAIKYNSEEEIEKRFQVMKEESKPYSKVLFDTKVIFQKWVRLRDSKQPCICCGVKESKQWDAGHFYDCETYPGLAFHPDNAHKQNCYCNDKLKGNVLSYRKGLVVRIGIERLRELDRLSHEAKGVTFTKKVLAEIAWKYKQEIKLLKQK